VFLIADMTTTLLIALPAVVVLVWLKYGAGGLWQSMQLLTDPRIWAMGAASEGAGLFGGLVFLAKTESTLSVPINRCSSLLGGTAATLALWWLDGGTLLGWAGRNVPELIGVVAMLAAPVPAIVPPDAFASPVAAPPVRLPVPVRVAPAAAASPPAEAVPPVMDPAPVIVPPEAVASPVAAPPVRLPVPVSVPPEAVPSTLPDVAS
jgi:hypothetical protein